MLENHNQTILLIPEQQSHATDFCEQDPKHQSALQSEEPFKRQDRCFSAKDLAVFRTYLC